MRGILTDAETGELLVKGGRAAVGDTEGQTAEAVLLSNRGEWKEWPLIGAEALQMLAGEPDPMWEQKTERMMRECGCNVTRVRLKDGEITVE